MTTTRRRWIVPAATLLLLVLGTVALTLAIAMAVAGSDAPADAPTGERGSPPASSAAPTVPVVPDDEADTAAAEADRAVSQLADPDWLAATAASTGLPERALAAYAGASVALAGSQPSCGLGWNTLAAIGQVESEHGEIGRAELDGSGVATPPIFGVALDGDGVARIPDTDRGRLDKDRSWDRAMGPMQFIPTTWEAHATDGNGDGTPDVQSIDDAALTAATYLCSGGDDLTRSESWIAAVAAYNPDTGYNNRVAVLATRYADAVGG